MKLLTAFEEQRLYAEYANMIYSTHGTPYYASLASGTPSSVSAFVSRCSWMSPRLTS